MEVTPAATNVEITLVHHLIVVRTRIRDIETTNLLTKQVISGIRIEDLDIFCHTVEIGTQRTAATSEIEMIIEEVMIITTNITLRNEANITDAEQAYLLC
jgi:DNA-binding protein